MTSMIIIMNGTIDKNNQITIMQKYFYQVIMIYQHVLLCEYSMANAGIATVE